MRLLVRGFPRGSTSWTRGAPSARASAGEKTPGNGSYSTSISSTASAAISGSMAATAAISSRNWRTLPCLRATLSCKKPMRTSGVFAAVITARTPGSRSALEMSMDTIRAWACSENLTLAWSIPGRFRSWMYSALPLALSAASGRAACLPM